jgi:hypothetical protein
MIIIEQTTSQETRWRLENDNRSFDGTPSVPDNPSSRAPFSPRHGGWPGISLMSPLGAPNLIVQFLYILLQFMMSAYLLLILNIFRFCD